MKRTRQINYSRYVVGLILITCIMMAVFIVYHNYRSEQFMQLENESITANLRYDAQKVDLTITSLSSRLRATSELITASKADPDADWIESFLENMGKANRCTIVYTTTARMHDYFTADQVSVVEFGGEIITNVSYSERYGKYCFAICVPVRECGGALVCVVDASRLLGEFESEEVHSIDGQYILSPDGTIEYATDESLIGTDYMDRLRSKGVSEADIERCLEALASGSDMTINVGNNGARRTVSAVALGHNSYSLVQLAQSQRIHDLSEKMQWGMTIASGTLIICTVLAMAILFSVNADRNRYLRREDMKFRAIASHFDTVIFEYDANADTLTFTIRDTPSFSMKHEEVRHCTTSTFDGVHEEDMDVLHELFKGALADDTEVAEFRMMNRSGEWTWCECRIEKLDLEKDDNVRIGQITSIEERKQREIQLEKENATDTLTGLLRYEAFSEQIGDCLDDRPGMFYFFDSNSLKKVNDTCGHEAGDELLRKTSAMIKRAFRASDLVSRRSGDEFIAYAAGFGNVEMARDKARHIIEDVAKIDDFEGIRASVSVGVARYPQDGRTLEELANAADEAMYVAKRVSNHSDFCCFFYEIDTIEKREG